MIGPVLLGHGVGGRSDLPVPTWLVGYAAGAVLVVSFVALAAFWRTPRLEGSAVDRGPVVLEHGPTKSVLAIVTRALGVVLFTVVVAAGLFGADDPLANLAPTAVYVTFWVGLTLVNALVGDIHRFLDPFETFVRVTGSTDGNGRPYRAGYWPAAIGLFGFVWLELVFDDGSRPVVLGIAALVLTAAMIAGIVTFGPAFVRYGNPFRAWFDLLAAMAPIADDGRGRARLRWPVVGLSAVRSERGTIALVMVALGSTAFDGITRSTVWTNLLASLDGAALTLAATAGLLGTIGVVAIVYLGAMSGAAMLTEGRGGATPDLAAAFVHTLVPIAFAYAVAHYLSLLLFEGQAFFALLSDPFGRGWDLFGTASNRIDFTVVAPRTISYLQVAAIALGHVAGVVLAHDRALVLFDRREATRSQYPLLVVMVLFTVVGLVLLLGG